MNKVFLGGTCNGSGWRDELKKQLKIPYFDPVVDDWDEEAQKNEIKERENADYCL
ncbi:MAG: nucleoside 2-deoxyribosyltransferase domain-containing protein, partial [Methanobrevibacter sp.]|nr:nucleoside 2-deoxyribosyltransferase domain-containing protein [Candidatus Methanovirga australis]